ncbi:MAG: PIN domain nuclease, partial [Anaerolineales bacterium]
MSADFIARITGMVVFSLFGGYGGYFIGLISQDQNIGFYVILVSLVGALFGLVMTPYFTTRPARAIKATFSRVSAESLFAGITGLVLGLVIAALLSFPLSLLPPPLSQILPFVAVVAFGYFGISLFVMRQADFFNVAGTMLGRSSSGERAVTSEYAQPQRTILVDTSVLIDGRIADIAKTGFLPGALLIPRFVLNELQYIADSSDALRRQRGRRGMEVLAELQKATNLQV